MKDLAPSSAVPLAYYVFAHLGLAVALLVLLIDPALPGGSLLGILIGFDRSRGFLGVSPLAAVFAHAHIAAIGWAVMMVVGLSYRLIPMMLPAAMPTGWTLALSAIAIESGLAVLVVTLLLGSDVVWMGAVLILAGFGCFVAQIRRTVARRLPRPPALPARDWSIWQTHAAFVWLLVAAVLGMALAIGSPTNVDSS